MISGGFGKSIRFQLGAVFSLALTACGSVGSQAPLGDTISAPVSISSPTSIANPPQSSAGLPGGSEVSEPSYNLAAAAPSQSSGAPNPNYDPNGDVILVAKLQTTLFQNSPMNGIGLVAARLSGKIDVSATNQKLKSFLYSASLVDLSYRILRIADPQQDNFVETLLHKDESNQDLYEFDLVFVMTPERFEELNEEFDLNLYVSPWAFRSAQPNLLPTPCPDEMINPGCGAASWEKVQVKWTPVAAAVDENLPEN